MIEDTVTRSPPPPGTLPKPSVLAGSGLATIADNGAMDPPGTSTQNSEQDAEGFQEVKRRRANLSPEGDVGRKPKIRRGQRVQPLTTHIEREFQRAMRELGARPQHSAKPNLTNIRKTQVSQKSSNVNIANSAITAGEDGINNATPELRLNSPFKTAIRNRFAALDNSEASATEANTNTQQSIDPSKIIDPPQNSRQTAGNNGENKPSKPFNNKLPPIICMYESTKALINLIKTKEPNASFTVKYIDTKEQSVLTDSLDSLQKIKSVLSAEKVQYYSHTPQELKKKLLVLKGLNSEYTDAEVKAGLVERFPDIKDTITVSKLKFKDSETLPFSHFLIQLPPNHRTKEMTDTRYFLNQPIRWNRFRKKQAFQCHNCQRIGHPSVECKMGYRCVKCNENHGPEQCKRTLNSENAEQAYCVNCKKSGHPANYRGCPYLKQAQEIVNERKKEERERALAKTHNTISSRRAGISYATASNPRAAQSSTTPDINMNRIIPPQHTNTHGGNELSFSAIRDLLTVFKTDICDRIDARSNTLQRQIDEQNSKIKNLYTALQLPWP